MGTALSKPRFLLCFSSQSDPRHTNILSNVTQLADKLNFDEDLDLKPYMLEPTADGQGQSDGEREGEVPAVESMYKLHAVLIHVGDADYGHYYAYVRPQLGSPRGGPWLCFDDSNVFEVPAKQVAKLFILNRVGILASGSWTADG